MKTSFGSLRFAAFGAAMYACVFGSGCAQERPAIDRVNANVLDKHFFVGNDLTDARDDPEFYWRNYVIDASPTQSLVGVGSWGGVDRIKWEITEQLLIARKAYEIATGQDASAQVDPNAPGSVDAYGNSLVPTLSGTVVAAYNITSHFDIRRDYNPQTGEELNVIVENTTDRPWNEREYMRVDWSTNVVSDPMWQDMFIGKTFGSINVTPLQYAVTDPRSLDAPHFEMAEGYFDITNKYYIAPAQTASPFSDYLGTVPTCYVVGLFTGSATYDCNAQEATVRHSYWKVDPNHDYEPLENTYANEDVIGNPGGLGSSGSIGIVTAGQQGWDPQYGYTDSLYHRFAHRHNVWQKSHQAFACTANDDADQNGTADQCENAVTNYGGSNGSQCDVFTSKCTIPYRDRQIKTVGYWVNGDAPLELQDPVDGNGNATGRGTLEDLVFSWNQLMTVGLAYAREVECRRTGDGDRDGCHAQFFSSTDDPNTKQMVSFGGWLVDVPIDTIPALTFCHNPVRAYDVQGTCGTTGDVARVGDVRKNFIFYWPYDSRAPWGGIANWNADPLSGEILGGAAAIMGRSATYAAALQRDVLQVAMGDVQISDLIEGAPAATYARMLTNGSMPSTPLSTAELQRRLQMLDVSGTRSSLGLPAPPLDGTQAVLQQIARQNVSVSDPTQYSTMLLTFDALAKTVQNTPAETQLVDSHWLVNALGSDPATDLTSTVLDNASILRGQDTGRLHAFSDVLNARLAERGVCFLDDQNAPAYGSVDMPSLASWFKAKYAGMDTVSRGKAIYNDLWHEAVKGIALHEIGHSLGMLHEFASSWDAVNYQPQYWQLRTNEGKAAGSCNGQPRTTGDNDTCMGPRYIDPETTDEQGLGTESRPDLQYFGNTSTMEYQLERFNETAGLGTFDLHTMKALYGRVIESLDDRQLSSAVQQGARWRNYSQLIERDLYQQGTSVGFQHYTTTARTLKVFDPVRDCRPATDAEKATGEWRIVHGKVCAPEPRDHWAWQDFALDDALKPFSNTAPFYHAKTPSKEYIRWFYRWGVSHNAYFHTNDSDAGADAYEVTMNTIKKFDVTYPWTYFRRQNKEYYYPSIPARIADVYLERVRAYHWQIATSLAQSTQLQLQDDDQARPEVVAQAEVFNFLARVLTMPEPGNFVSNVEDASVASRTPPEMGLRLLYDVPDFAGTSSDFTLGIVDARYTSEAYNNQLGGSWDYLNWIDHAGFSVEKTRAISALVDGRPTLYTISRANALDGRANFINFRNDLPQATDRIVGGILSGDWDTIAEWVPGTGTTVSPAVLDLTQSTPTRPSDARVLFPNIGYKTQLATALMVALHSRLSTDMQLMDKMRVWIDGQVGGITIPDSQQVRFTDPTSGYTYVARKYGSETIDDRTVDTGIASRMIAHANALLAAAYQVVRNTDGSLVVDSYGAPTLILDKNGNPQPVYGAVSPQDVGNYVGLLDTVKQIEGLLGYGPL